MSTPSIYRESAGSVLDLVGKAEERFKGGHWDGTRGRGGVYRKIGTWLIEESYLNRLIFRGGVSTQRLPGLELAATAKGRWWLLWKRGFGTRVSGKCAAQAIRRKKTNLRAFYLDEKAPGGITGTAFSTKIILQETSERIARLEAEIRSREAALGTGALKIPALLEYDLKSAPAYYSEEIIWGRTCRESDAELILSELFPRLARFYQGSGISWKRVRSVVSPKSAEAIRRAMQRVEWRPQWLNPARFQEAMDRLVQSRERVPCSFCHGDLQPSNLIITPARDIYVVDWEAARHAPIVFDLFNMVWFFSWALAGVKKLMEGLGGSEENQASFSRQLLLANLAAIAAREARVQMQMRSTRRKVSLREELTDLFERANRSMEEI